MRGSRSRRPDNRVSESGTGSDANRILIVAPSPIDRIVVARTIERIYLKPNAVVPEEALRALAESKPVLVIIDRAVDDGLLEQLAAELARRRHASGTGLPRVLLIEGPHRRDQALHLAGLVDVVVSKPITQDTLQPAVERLVKT